MDSKLINLTGLWINKSKDGSQFLSGSLGMGGTLLVFKNTKKRPNSKDPDYNVCIAPRDLKEQKPKQDSEEF